MALKSSREGLRKELVDYLGNLIVDDNLRNEIVKAVGDRFVTSEVLNENVNNLTMQITTESGERIEADTTLQNNITAEATAREGADTTLQNNITAEATSREGADTTLQNNINAEATARQEAISNLEELIGNSGLKMDLLWTNASTTSDFLPQTINLDLISYKYLIMIVYHIKGESYFQTCICFKGQNILSSICSSPVIRIARRNASVLDDSIAFDDGYDGDRFDGNSISNAKCIPYQIFGVK